MPEHRALFSSALLAAGIDVDTACAAGDLTMLDAAETLDRFMIDGSPDPSAFTDAVGALIRAHGDEGRQVRIYGEMVAWLWDVGNVTGAIELERLWNDLGARVPFSLFCAYPSRIASDPHAAHALAEVCHLHSNIVGTAPASAS